MAKASLELAVLRKACKEASKKIRNVRDSVICRNLQDAGLDALQAYKLGQEEAQGAVVGRLLRLIVQQQSTDDRPSGSREGGR
jgi:hypothetical protein